MTQPMAVPFTTLACPVCGRFTDVRADELGVARCAHCQQRFSAPLEGVDWPNVARLLLGAGGMVAIVIVLTVVMPGGLAP